MSFSARFLDAQLALLEKQAARPKRYVVAFSGGLDSTVLAHALASLAVGADIPVVAFHVDHGLHPDSARWRAHCESVANRLGVAYLSRSVEVDLDAGLGPEAAARTARYAALRNAMERGDWLLSAHHREDQAETLLLNLVRGSGPAGLAGIGAIRRFGPGWLARPLLDADRSSLLAYAEAHDLLWIEDPSNTDRRFDRNFLRHEILPALQSRWPDIAARLQRSASHAGEAADLLADLAALDLASLGGDPQRLALDALLDLSPARQRNLVRYALRELGLPMPTAVQLERVLTEVLPAREDAQPHVGWRGAAVRRYRNGLYLLPDTLAELPDTLMVATDEVVLGPGMGALRLDRGAESGLSPALVSAGLRLEKRRGGEEFQPLGQSHTRKLKKLLQEEGVVPWMRDRLPLVYAGSRLVAVGDLWMAADATSSPGVAVRWDDRPALH